MSKTPTGIAREAADKIVDSHRDTLWGHEDDLAAIILRAAQQIVEATGARAALDWSLTWAEVAIDNESATGTNMEPSRRWLAKNKAVLVALDALRTEAGK